MRLKEKLHIVDRLMYHYHDFGDVDMIDNFNYTFKTKSDGLEHTLRFRSATSHRLEEVYFTSESLELCEIVHKIIDGLELSENILFFASELERGYML